MGTTNIPHGTTNGYRRHACRCVLCKEAQRKAVAAQRARRKAKTIPSHVHGSVNGYQNYGCRQECCRKAQREAQAKAQT